ncbi:MAG: hypothetical protein ACXAB4_06020 [Candidatus Hodarchaeales archaeon]|jgi:hypothetical protein
MSALPLSESEYQSFQKRILGELHGILMRGEVLRRGEGQASEVWDLVHSHTRFNQHYGQYRPELIKKYGEITDSQFFAATIGDKMNFGDPLSVFQDCFATLDHYKAFLDSKRISYEWTGPPDLHSTILQGAHYLLAPELIHLGSLLSSGISGILLFEENLVKEFLRRLIRGDRELVQQLVQNGIINRWFYLRKEPPYLQNPYESLAPSLISRSIPREIVLVARVANLVSIGLGSPLPLDTLLEATSIHEELASFSLFLSEKLYSRLKKRVLRSAIENVIHKGFINLSGFRELDEIALSIYEYSEADGVEWTDVQDLVTSIAISALKKSSKPSIKRSMDRLNLIRFGSGFDPNIGQLDVPAFVELLRAFYDSARDVLEERKSEYLSSASLEVQDVRADYKQQVGDLQGRIEFVAKSYLHLVRKLIEGTPKTEEAEFIAKAAAFLSSEAFAHLDDIHRERVAQTIFGYLSREIHQCRDILGDVDLHPFLMDEIELLSDVLRLNQILGVFAREWSMNSSFYLHGKAAYAASQILREWLILPRDKLARKIDPSRTNDCMIACGRNDIRNYYLLAAIEYLNSKDFNEGLERTHLLFPNPIPPGKKFLFADGSGILQLLTDGTLKHLSEKQWNP